MFFCDAAIAVSQHDRRGHGRSSQPWSGNDMDTYAGRSGKAREALSLKDASTSAFKPGVVKSHVILPGTVRNVLQGRASLGGAPLMLRTTRTQAGCQERYSDDIRGGVVSIARNSSKLAVPFYGYNRSGAKSRKGAGIVLVQGMCADFLLLTSASKRFPKPINTKT